MVSKSVVSLCRCYVVMIKKREYLIAFAVIAFLATFFNHRYINDFPSQMHAWAQCDRYALALGFVDNNLNLFSPQTYVYNKQVPGFIHAFPNTVTAVDFPLHDYIPAVIMKITGDDSPRIFRSYTLVYSCVGLFFLFLTARLITGDFWKSLLVLLFAATSPVFVYYQGGFLPTIPSLANAMIGLFFYVRNVYNGRKRDFAVGILFLTLAALSRTPFAIVLIAVLGLEFLRVLRKEAGLRQRIIPVLLSVAAIGGYLLYNNILRKSSGSMFISTPGPVHSWKEASEILNIVWKQWILVYFSLSHYVVIGLAILLATICVIFRKRSRSRFRWQMNLMLFAWLFGSLVYSILMLTKFREHDYYIMDALFLPVLFLLILLLAAIPKLSARYTDWISVPVLVTVAVLWGSSAFAFQVKRHLPSSWDRNYKTMRDYDGAGELLDSLGYGQDARIVSVFHTSPNMPFIMMKRNGYFIPAGALDILQESFRWDFDCMIIPDRYLEEVYSLYPSIVKRIRKVGGNGRLTVYVAVSDAGDQTIIDLAGLNRRTPVFTSEITFDEVIPDTSWKGVILTDQAPYSGMYAGMVSGTDVWGAAWRSDTLAEVFRGRNRTVVVHAKVRNQDCDACYMVLQLLVNGKNLFYKVSDLAYISETTGDWKEIIILGELPRLQDTECSFSVYVWNDKLCNLAYDDIKIEIY